LLTIANFRLYLLKIQSKTMDQILTEVTEMRKDLTEIKDMLTKISESDRWQSVPRAAVYLGLSEKMTRYLCVNGYIPCVLLKATAKRPRYRVDVLEAEKWMADGGITSELKRLVK
jgi:hypothetical protein